MPPACCDKPDCACRPSAPDAVELLLKHTLRTVLSGSVLAGAGLLPGCIFDSESKQGNSGETHDAAMPGTDGAVPGPDGQVLQPDSGTEGAVDGGLPPLGPPIVCSADGGVPILANFDTPVAYDFIQLRVRYDILSEQDAGTGWITPITTSFQLGPQTGTACATATTPECADKIAHHEEPFQVTKWDQVPSERSVVTTRGDDVRRWLGLDQVRSLLGPINTLDEALLLVLTANFGLVCDDATQSSAEAVSDGYLIYATKRTSDCAPIDVRRFKLHVSHAGVISELGSELLFRDPTTCIGRKPDGLRSSAVLNGRSKLADFLARCAHLEAASIFSFERMRRELAAHQAPAALVARAREARDDEARHARVMGGLARLHGSELNAIDVTSMHVRSLEEIALENAVEGCVRETYGALVGAHQALKAQDLGLRRALGPIAADEARHASLSHAVHAWLEPQLGDASRERVRAAMTRAVVVLREELSAPSDAELVQLAGLPPANVAAQLVQHLAAMLWAPALRRAA
jgi:hypothetical protein